MSAFNTEPPASRYPKDKEMELEMKTDRKVKEIDTKEIEEELTTEKKTHLREEFL